MERIVATDRAVAREALRAETTVGGVMARRFRRTSVAAVALAALLAAGVAWATTIVGTAKGDVLRGSAHADRLFGRAGNDRLYGRGGDDLLVGGTGADLLACGAGHDVAVADENDTLTGCEVVKGLPKAPPPPPPPPSPDKDRLYIALGASVSAGTGSSATPWVSLYFGYLASTIGVTRLHNLADFGATSAMLRAGQLTRAVALIDAPSDAVRVTIDIGRNDPCEFANEPGCQFADNLRAILTTLNGALGRDPGDETIQVMEYYNPDIALPGESATRAYLLGSDLKVDCSGTGGALGLNDLIHCIALEKGALPVDVLPIFDAAGERFLADDHRHPNDAGHRAIAEAFGGAVERSP